MLSFIVIALIIAGAIGYFTRNSGSRQPVRYDPRSAEPAGPDPAQARAEAGHWVELLGAGLTGLDGVTVDDDGKQRAARFALSDAAERHAAATQQLAQGDSVHHIDLAGRTALEGLHYLRAARSALGLDPGPAVPATAQTGELTGHRTVYVSGEQFEASAEPGQRTPYYYPGGNVRGRNVPAGWYSTPWWKTALVAGAAGMGSLLVVDALFGHDGLLGHHGGPGGPMDHMGVMGGGGDGDGFLDGGWF